MKKSGKDRLKSTIYGSTLSTAARSPFPNGEGYETRTPLSPFCRIFWMLVSFFLVDFVHEFISVGEGDKVHLEEAGELVPEVGNHGGDVGVMMTLSICQKG